MIDRKIPVLEPLFNKAAGLQVCNLFKKRLQRMCSPVNIAKFLIAPILKKICKQMHLNTRAIFYRKENVLFKNQRNHMLCVQCLLFIVDEAFFDSFFIIEKWNKECEVLFLLHHKDDKHKSSLWNLHPIQGRLVRASYT